MEKASQNHWAKFLKTTRSGYGLTKETPQSLASTTAKLPVRANWEAPIYSTGASLRGEKKILIPGVNASTLER